MKLFKTISKILLTISVIVVLIIAGVNLPNRKCEGMKVRIHYQKTSSTVTHTDVYDMIRHAGIKTKGEKMKTVNLTAITDILRTNPFIKSVNEVFFSGAFLVIDVTLKNVLLHVYPVRGEQYFIDDEGGFLPYSPRICESILVANGFINQPYCADKSVVKQKSALRSVYKIALAVHADPFYNAQFRQFYVNDRREVEIVPTVGNHIILFGDESDCDKKLFNLRQTYQNGMVYSGTDRYSQLDVRFKNRVIAKKR